MGLKRTIQEQIMSTMNCKYGVQLEILERRYYLYENRIGWNYFSLDLVKIEAQCDHNYNK